ncbi:MAG: ligand-gated channel protein [bacterium]|nr:ligand-gated channel protein [bacterium]
MRVVATAVVMLLCVSVARGDASDDARALFEHGTALYALHRFAEAATQFEKAFELKPDPAILYNAAQAHRFAGNKARSLELYESYLRLYGERPNAAEVSDHIRELRGAIDAERRATNAPPTGPAQMSPPRPGEPPPTGAVPRPAEAAPAVAATPAPSAAPVAVSTERTSRPLAKRPWFWVVVGGAAVVVATGVALGVTLGSSTKDPTPSYGVANGN